MSAVNLYMPINNYHRILDFIYLESVRTPFFVATWLYLCDRWFQASPVDWNPVCHLGMLKFNMVQSIVLVNHDCLKDITWVLENHSVWRKEHFTLHLSCNLWFILRTNLFWFYGGWGGGGVRDAAFFSLVIVVLMQTWIVSIWGMIVYILGDKM